MEFFSGLLMMIGGWFGLVEPVEPINTDAAVIVEEVSHATEEVAEVMSEAGAEESSDNVPEEEPATEVADAEVTADATDELGLEDTSDAMTGNAKPITMTDTTTNNEAATTPNLQTMLVAGGCFWCVEADLEKTPGVISAVSGYAGGTSDNPTYDDYGSGGHREVVEVTYDANQLSYEDVLIVTMKTTDPTDDNGTFKDRGDKYSSAFYYETAEQKAIIENLIAEVNENGPYAAPLAIDVEERPQFWPAEDFHQDYYKGSLIQQAKYNGYRTASGRSAFIKEHWGEDKSSNLPWRTQSANTTSMNDDAYPWSNYVKPDIETLRSTMDSLAFRVTQEDGTERAGTSPLDKIYEPGIYVDVLSGEPLFSSKDKFDSGTGWPSFVAPITPDALTEHEDRKLFTVRTETRSAIADNHIGHVFTDGPADRGGLRYCMNGAALRFVPEADMVAEGYSDFLSAL